MRSSPATPSTRRWYPAQGSGSRKTSRRSCWRSRIRCSVFPACAHDGVSDLTVGGRRLVRSRDQQRDIVRSSVDGGRVVRRETQEHEVRLRLGTATRPRRPPEFGHRYALLNAPKTAPPSRRGMLSATDRSGSVRRFPLDRLDPVILAELSRLGHPVSVIDGEAASHEDFSGHLALRSLDDPARTRL